MYVFHGEEGFDVTTQNFDGTWKIESSNPLKDYESPEEFFQKHIGNALHQKEDHRFVSCTKSFVVGMYYAWISRKTQATVKIYVAQVDSTEFLFDSSDERDLMHLESYQKNCSKKDREVLLPTLEKAEAMDISGVLEGIDDYSTTSLDNFVNQIIDKKLDLVQMVLEDNPPIIFVHALDEWKEKCTLRQLENNYYYRHNKDGYFPLQEARERTTNSRLWFDEGALDEFPLQ